VRDPGFLDSALDRPPNGFHYEPRADLVDPAASYGYGPARYHPSVPQLLARASRGGSIVRDRRHGMLRRQER
jgi:hypothetical protein